MWESREAGWRDQVVMEKSGKKKLSQIGEAAGLPAAQKNKLVVKFDVLLLLRMYRMPPVEAS